jgi:hypothetical protein
MVFQRVRRKKSRLWPACIGERGYAAHAIKKLDGKAYVDAI